MAEARTKKLGNPFYAALLVAGVVFGVSSVAYVVMMVQLATPNAAAANEPGLVAWMSRNGTTLIAGELATLAILTVLSIATDDWWTGDAGKSPESVADSTPPESPS